MKRSIYYLRPVNRSTVFCTSFTNKRKNKVKKHKKKSQSRACLIQYDYYIILHTFDDEQFYFGGCNIDGGVKLVDFSQAMRVNEQIYKLIKTKYADCFAKIVIEAKRKS